MLFRSITGLSGKNQIYYKSSEGACFAPKFDSVEVVINDIPTVTSVTAPSVCAKSLGNMTAKVPFGNVYWYEDSLATDPLFVGSSYDLGLMLSNRTAWYQTENNGCRSERKAVTVVVKPRPAAGFTWNLLWQFKLNCVPISTTGLTFEWDWGDGTKKTGLPGVHQYTQAGTYTVRLIATSNTNGCKDTADISVLVDHTATKNIAKTRLVAYPNPISAGETIHLDGLGNSKVQWVDALGRIVGQGVVKESVVVVPEGLGSG